ncbi:PREDICTED: uncharacterized protein LOC104812931 [Tarenaya hassleriana]|uniref:uncharacterized protein LOC104812931 n=1 Tax=Tarenaya hassleriana TaxID=28532 RepID=UPI00053C56AB|nr:PREDICTED: uncharacterized protein LOC104812931 [Tarenaya hassleriana]
MAESKGNVGEVSYDDSSSGNIVPSDPREAEIQQRLEQLNKPAVKSVLLPGGDIIDFVPIREQLAFDDPLLKDHIIQMKPSSYPKGSPTEEEEGEASVIVRPYGECPEGTIPVRRTTREDLLRAESIENYGKKRSNYRLPGPPDAQ